MDGATVSKLGDAITDKLQSLVDSFSKSSAFFSAYVYPMYIEAQKERWSTNNSGDKFAGGEWAPIKTEQQRKYKEKKYKNYPGGGLQMLVRTSKLYASIVDPNDTNHQAIFGDNTMTINTTIKYAGYVDQGTHWQKGMVARPFSQFSDSFNQSILDSFNSYVAGL